MTLYPFIDWQRFSWLSRSGVPTETMVSVVARTMLAKGRIRHGEFEDDDTGETFLVFEQEGGLIYWQPRTGQIAAGSGRAFALGEDIIDAAETYSFDCHLNIFVDPLEWLRNRCDGIVVVDWACAFDRLRHVPRLAVAEDLLPTYRANMRPAGLPDVAVITSEWRVAA
jgi:hypothetical protein